MAAFRSAWSVWPQWVQRNIDAWVEKLNKANPLGRRWTRTDVAQECLAWCVQRWGAQGVPPGAGDKGDAS